MERPSIPETVHEVGVVPGPDPFFDIVKQKIGPLEFKKPGYIKPLFFIISHHVVDPTRKVGHPVMGDLDLPAELVNTCQAPFIGTWVLFVKIENKCPAIRITAPTGVPVAVCHRSHPWVFIRQTLQGRIDGLFLGAYQTHHTTTHTATTMTKEIYPMLWYTYP